MKSDSPHSPESSALPARAPGLWPLLVIDGACVGGILTLFAIQSGPPSTLALASGALGISAAGIATAWAWWRVAERSLAQVDSGPGADREALEAIRREQAENLKLLQDDMHAMGQAILKRLAPKAEARPEYEHYEALAGTVSDLAVNVAAAAADTAEAKSAVFEMQAQLDQLADAWRAAASGVAPALESPGAGVAPGAMARALAGGVGGGAVARLIANGVVSERAGSTDVEDQHPEGVSPPVLESPDALRAAAGGAPESEDADGVDYDESGDLEASPAVFAEAETRGAEGELVAAEDAEDLNDDWLTGGLDEPEADFVDMPELTTAPVQPELLALDESAGAKRPRRPVKGETALIAHVMIGIGNKPYLRGIGPGLSTEKGVPMDYVEVGVWQWICPERDAPVALSIWKNDEMPADGELIELEPGEQVEVRPHFGL